MSHILPWRILLCFKIFVATAPGWSAFTVMSTPSSWRYEHKKENKTKLDSEKVYLLIENYRSILDHVFNHQSTYMHKETNIKEAATDEERTFGSGSWPSLSFTSYCAFLVFKLISPLGNNVIWLQSFCQIIILLLSVRKTMELLHFGLSQWKKHNFFSISKHNVWTNINSLRE